MNLSLVRPRTRIILSRIFVILLVLLLCIALEGWHAIAPFFEESLSLLGWTLIGVGVMGRVWAGSHIGGQKNSTLTQSGPYSMCRNPLYLCSFIGGLGVMIVTETLLLPLVFIPIFAMYYPKVIASEEKFLLSKYGAQFEAYCAKVPRFWPRFSLFSEPDSYAVSARHFKTSLSETIWFIIAGGAVEFIEGLHESGMLPTLFHLY